MLSDIHGQVRDALGRGTSQDALIPAKVRQAARWLERNYSFKYMEKFALLTIDSEADYPRVVAFPTSLVKTIDMVRISSEGADYSYLIQVDPKDMVRVGTGKPEGYWLDGVDSLVLNANPGENYTMEVLYNQYSDWPTDLNAEPWLVVNAEDALVAKAMTYFAPQLRDSDMKTRWDGTLKEALDTLLKADEELRQSNRSERLGYA